MTVDFSDKILVAVGDSFVYGHLGDDLETESCHNRSWVKKLERLGNFKSSINLGVPGGSNQRSYRVLMDFLNDYGASEDYYVIFGITDISRFELPVSRDHGLFPLPALCPYERENDYQNNTIGLWTLDAGPDSFGTKVRQDLHQYLSLHYGYFYHEKYENNLLKHYLLSIHLMLEHFNIQHSFVEFVGNNLNCFDAGKKFNINLPTINFYQKNTRYRTVFKEFMISHNYAAYPCSHYDDVGNEFIAEYFLWQISTIAEKNRGL